MTCSPTETVSHCGSSHEEAGPVSLFKIIWLKNNAFLKEKKKRTVLNYESINKRINNLKKELQKMLNICYVT